MKFLAITFFLFCLHISMAFFNASGLFGYALQPHSQFLNAISNQGLKNDSYTRTELGESQMDFGDYVKALFYFVVNFGIGVIVVPYTLNMLGLGSPYNILLSLPIYFIYIVALIQIISKDSYKVKY